MTVSAAFVACAHWSNEAMTTKVEIPALIETKERGWILVGQATRADLLAAVNDESAEAWRIKGLRGLLKQCGDRLLEQATVGQVLGWSHDV